MNARLEVAQPRLDWQRVGAMSVAFSVHVAAAFVLAMPLLPAAPRAISRNIDVVMLRDEPPPPLPIPPEILPKPRSKPMHAPTQAVPKPQPVRDNVVDVAPPIPDAPTAAPSTPTSNATQTDIGAGDSGGASRVLAYDGALKLRYPPTSIRAHEEGQVLLNVLVDADGHAQRVEIARGSGHAALDAAAREAVLRARFKPVLRDGVAISAWGVVPIRFRLDEA